LFDYVVYPVGTSYNWIIWEIDKYNKTTSIKLSGCKGEYYPHRKAYKIGLDEQMFTGFVVNEIKLEDGTPITLQQAIDISEI